MSKQKFIPRTNEDFELPLLSELEGTTFIINSIEYGKTNKGKYAVLEVVTNEDKPENVEKYRTSGQVLLEQLDLIKEQITDKGDTAEVTLKQQAGKEYNYYQFVAE